jgi:hypothetical protein
VHRRGFRCVDLRAVLNFRVSRPADARKLIPPWDP